MPVDPLQYLLSLEQFGIKFGLANIRALVAALGHPERAFASIHIAGTNGKGSVTAMIESVLRAAGYRTGRYTSPHLNDLSERIAINGTPIRHALLVDVASAVHQCANALQESGTLLAPPTFFEATTAAAFEAFRRTEVDIAVCEVGLGGRLDATNILTPAVTAITSIALDHQRYLGNTLADIAAEKGGIIKEGVPVVVGAMDEAVVAVLSNIAHQCDARLIRADQCVTVSGGRAPSGSTQSLRLRTAARNYGTMTLALVGAHQVANALVAVRVLEELDARGWPVPVESVIQGLAAVRWPGRLERIAVGAGRELLLDAAHNPAGAETLARFLAGEEKRPLVFAAMTDKDAAGILRALAPAVSALVITRASHPRSTDPWALAVLAAAAAPSLSIAVEESPRAALETAWRASPRIVVAGSIFLLGDVMKALDLS